MTSHNPLDFNHILRQVEAFNLRHSLLGKPLDVAFEARLLAEEHDEIAVAAQAGDRAQVLDGLVDAAYILLGSMLKNQYDQTLEPSEVIANAKSFFNQWFEIEQGIARHGFTVGQFMAGFALVHQANMTKPVDPTHSGKVRKGDNFIPPDLSSIV